VRKGKTMTTKKNDSIVPQLNLEANVFTFSGDRTSIAYFTQTPGPVKPGEEGGKLEYQGIEGNHTFFGKDIRQQESPLGILLTVTLKLQVDIGGITLTVLVPQVFGVTKDQPVTFETIAIKASSRGFISKEGAGLTYTILPLLARAEDRILPL
jgi:hypothetical protein